MAIATITGRRLTFQGTIRNFNFFCSLKDPLERGSCRFSVAMSSKYNKTGRLSKCFLLYSYIDLALYIM